MIYTKTLLGVAILISSFVLFGQTIRTVDNNYNAPTGALIYATIQEAIDASDPGDMIYVQPSPTTYGSATIEKEIHLVGIGFGLDKDLPLQSNMTDVFFRNNADNTSDASNSTVTGLTLRYLYFTASTGAPAYTLTGVEIINNVINQIRLLTDNAPTSNLLLAENRFTSTINFDEPMTGFVFRNNLFEGVVQFFSSGTTTGLISNNIFYNTIYKTSEGDNLIIQNNNFIGTTGSNAAFTILFRDVDVVNNIFYGRTPSIAVSGSSTSTNFQRNTFTNNLSFSTGNDALPPSGGGVGNSGDGNIIGTTPSFVDAPLLSSWSSSYDFTLNPGSAAENAGTDDTDIGITGGPYPFTESNFSSKTTALPTIQIFNVNTIINPGDDLDVRINVKAN